MISEAHSIVGMLVSQRADEDEPITMALVHDVIAELAAHPAGCGCGCS